MKRGIIAAVATGTGVAVLGLTFAGAVGAGNGTMLEFNVMVGVPSAYTNAQHPIRGINGGGVPWVIASGKGELSAGGDLEVKVTGLVLASSGSNPISSFKAIVSCQDGSGGVTNVTTAAFPATTGLATAGGGNAKFEGQLSLPQPCIAPIVFVTSPGSAWFASTGF
jgi:hypothetical protein